MNRKNQSKSVPSAPRTVSPGAGAMIRGAQTSASLAVVLFFQSSTEIRISSRNKEAEHMTFTYGLPGAGVQRHTTFPIITAVRNRMDA